VVRSWPVPPAWQVGPNRKVPLLVCNWYTEEGRFIQEHGTLDSKLRAMLKLVHPDKAEKLRSEGQTHTIEELTEYATQLSMLRALLAHTPSPFI
jgi:hypothetical protein